jgi:iron complex outermembrane recepter protein
MCSPFIRPVSRYLAVPLLALWAAGPAGAQSAAIASEHDFLQDMPVVLSVSRLPQRLDEAPGAVTVLDRAMIRRSGARDVADLLLLVPGFQTSTAFDSDAPQASYHGGFTNFSGRIQVLVDGRSAYSPYLFGSVAPGLQSVAINDIERIEVLRGSNSAAYGARAFLGVINIVTRDPVDTLGVRAQVAHGENGVRDVQASVGWAMAAGHARLGVDQRGDDGLSGAYGKNTVSRVNLRANLRATPVDELQLRVGALGIDAGTGFAGDVGRPQRMRQMGNNFLQLDWQRNLAQDADLALSFSHMDETYQDSFSYALPAPFSPLLIDSSGRARSDTVSAQHTLRMNPALRWVYGLELRQEQVVSAPLYATDTPQKIDFARLFGNAEWHLGHDLLLNVGGLVERNSRSGESFSPRVMLNWLAVPGHTLRAGVSRAYRPPSTFEMAGNVRYVANGVLLQVNTLATGGARPESVLARELGYLGEFKDAGLSLDVRVFDERIVGFIREQAYALPAGSQLIVNVAGQALTNDFVNLEDFSIHGLEYQLKWHPMAGAQLMLNQAYTQSDARYRPTAAAAPQSATTLMWTHRIPAGLDFSLIHHERSPAKLQATTQEFAMSRTDLRLGLPLQWGKSRGEVALVMQNLGAPYRDFDHPFEFRRRAFVTLQMDY